MRKLIILLALMLSGCVSVETTTTAFFVDTYSPSGSVAVVSEDIGAYNGVEFATYRKQAEAKLTAAGYEVVEDPQKAKYVAMLSYGIDNGTNTTISIPQYGKTGGATYHSTGSVTGLINNSLYSGQYRSTTVKEPTYGYLGSVDINQKVYNRFLTMTIFEVLGPTGPYNEIYRAVTVSEGTCSSIAGVYPALLDGIFKGFPGKSGRPKTSSYPLNGSC